MPLDKEPDPGAFAPTHKSVLLHVRGRPVACIVDAESPPPDLGGELAARLDGFVCRHEELGLLLGLRLSVQAGGRLREYVAYPSEEVADAVILNDTVCITDPRMNMLASLRLSTDQFVKARSEYEGFLAELGRPKH